MRLDRKVFLVTGASGFIGSNIVNELLIKGATVVGIDNFSNSDGSNINKHLSNQNFTFLKGDICDYNTCLSITKGVEYVLHQAGLGSIPRSISDPRIYEENNIKGTSNLFEACRENQVKRIIYASSSSVYGDIETLPKEIGQEGNLLSPYALSKKINEEYGKLYNQVYGVETIGLRYFNVFGMNQNENSPYAALIPKFIKGILANEEIRIFGTGNQSRDFTYVEDVVNANILACFSRKDSCGGVYNISGGKSYSVSYIYKLLVKNIKPNYSKLIYVESRKGDILHSLASLKKSSLYLNYNASTDLEKNLVETIKSYKKKSF